MNPTASTSSDASSTRRRVKHATVSTYCATRMSARTSDEPPKSTEADANTCSEFNRRCSQTHQTRDHEALHFVRALADLVDLLIAVHARNRIFVHESVAAVNLQRLVDDAARKFAGEEFGKAGGAARSRGPWSFSQAARSTISLACSISVSMSASLNEMA